MEKDLYPQAELFTDRVQYVSTDRCTKCPICGKIFTIFILRDYVYKIKHTHGQYRFMCGWKCFRQAENLKLEKLKYHPRIK